MPVWFATSLVANGQEFKRFVDVFKEKTELMCTRDVAETNFEFRYTGICMCTVRSKYSWRSFVYKRMNPVQESKHNIRA